MVIYRLSFADYYYSDSSYSYSCSSTITTLASPLSLLLRRLLLLQLPIAAGSTTTTSTTSATSTDSCPVKQDREFLLACLQPCCRLHAVVFPALQVMLFMKGSKVEPFCKFSKQAFAAGEIMPNDFLQSRQSLVKCACTCQCTIPTLGKAAPGQTFGDLIA